jgi:hypothetical protein
MSWTLLFVLVFSLAAGGCGGGDGRINTGGGDIPIDVPIPPVEEDLLAVTPVTLVLKVGEVGSVMAYNVSGTLEWGAQNESVAVYPTNATAARVVAIEVGETDVIVFDSSGAEAKCHVIVTEGTISLPPLTSAKNM